MARLLLILKGLYDVLRDKISLPVLLSILLIRSLSPIPLHSHTGYHDIMPYFDVPILTRAHFKCRLFPTMPLVKLGVQFKKVSAFLSRFATIPKIIELDHFTVSGDVHFGRNVELRSC